MRLRIQILALSILIAISTTTVLSQEQGETELKAEAERLMRIADEKYRRKSTNGCPHPIVRVHQDPDDQAILSGTTGWVMVRLTISKTGEVENPVTVAADPPGVFETSALEIVMLNKYKPQVVDEEPVPYDGWAERVDFLRYGEEPGSNWPMPSEFQEGRCVWLQ